MAHAGGEVKLRAKGEVSGRGRQNDTPKAEEKVAKIGHRAWIRWREVLLVKNLERKIESEKSGQMAEMPREGK